MDSKFPILVVFDDATGHDI